MNGHLVLRLPQELPELVLATPLIEAARPPDADAAPATSAERSPWERVTLLVPRHLQALLEAEPDTGRAHGGLELVPFGPARDEAAALERLAPDAVLLLDHSLASALRARRARVPVRVGLGLGPRRALLTHCVLPPSAGGRALPVPEAGLLRDLGALVGLRPATLDPVLAMREESRASLVQRLRGAGLVPGEPHLVVAPSAPPGGADLWPPASWADLCGALALRRGWRTLVLSLGEAEREAARSIASLAAAGPAATRGVPVHLHLEPGELHLLAPLVAGASLVLGGTRGPQGVAAALGVPSVTVTGARHGVRLLPPTSDALLVQGPDLECAPCLEARCPLGHHACLEELGVARVAGPVDELLRELEEERAAEALRRAAPGGAR